MFYTHKTHALVTIGLTLLMLYVILYHFGGIHPFELGSVSQVVTLQKHVVDRCWGRPLTSKLLSLTPAGKEGEPRVENMWPGSYQVRLLYTFVMSPFVI